MRMYRVCGVLSLEVRHDWAVITGYVYQALPWAVIYWQARRVAMRVPP